MYAGETYPIGQFGSIVRIHFGRRLIYALVGRLRMKAEYEAERGIASQASADERVVEADLFGEGEWIRDAAGNANLAFERGVATYPCRSRRSISPPSRNCASSTDTRRARLFASANMLGRVAHRAMRI